jgi:hypothetical protein
MQTLKLLEARVARARAVLDAAIETRAREHALAAIEEYAAAAAARVAAEQSLAMALTAEDEAAKKVDEALRAIEENC